MSTVETISSSQDTSILASQPLDATDELSRSRLPVRSLAYLCSQYPMLSMIFVLREVVQLREMGFRLDVASINTPDRPPAGLTAQEASEASQAYHLKKNGIRDALKAHAQTLLQNFGGYFRGLALVARLSGLDIKQFALNFMYFTEKY